MTQEEKEELQKERHSNMMGALYLILLFIFIVAGILASINSTLIEILKK
jgi:hypothetical protein